MPTDQLNMQRTESSVSSTAQPGAGNSPILPYHTQYGGTLPPGLPQGLPQYSVVSPTTGGSILHHGIWTQLAKQGLGPHGPLPSPETPDDIIQKSLVMSGISQDLVEGSQIPKQQSSLVGSVENQLEAQQQKQKQQQIEKQHQQNHPHPQHYQQQQNRQKPEQKQNEVQELQHQQQQNEHEMRFQQQQGHQPLQELEHNPSPVPGHTATAATRALVSDIISSQNALAVVHQQQSQNQKQLELKELEEQAHQLQLLHKQQEKKTDGEPEVETELERTCTICSESFDTVQAMLFHRREHVDICQFECASCNALFRLSSELQKHVQTCKMARKSRPYQCESCEMAFYKKSAFLRHLQKHVESKPRFACDGCAKTFASEAYMLKHRIIHEEAQENNEKNVDESFQDGKENKKRDDDPEEEAVEERKDVFRSLRKREKKSLSEFDLIGSDIDEEYYLKTVYHKPRSKSGPRVARKSKAIQEKRVKIAKHKLGNQGVKKKLVCGKCGEQFDTIEQRTVHVQNHVPSLTEKDYMCLVCGKSYTMSCNLERHSLIHTNTRSHRCDICGKGFHRVDILDRHRRIHTGEKPHQCPQCEMRFISSAALLTHKKRAHEIKRFACTKCAECFFTEKLLARHMKMHDSDRRFTCERCGKSFINSSNLKTHLRIHTKEKPYVCDYCGEKFTQKAHVERHLVIHTRPKPLKEVENPPLNPEAIQQVVKQLYFCNVCNKSFPKRRGLRMHERMRHGLGKNANKPKPQVNQSTPNQPPQLQNQTLQHPQTWYPPVIPQQQQQHIQPPPQQQQQQVQYTVNQVQHCTVYNTTNGVYTQQYLPQGMNQQFDIQIHQPLGQDDPVVFTAADSHDTIMYLIEAAASSNMINQPLQHQQQQQQHNTLQAQMMHPQSFNPQQQQPQQQPQHSGNQRFAEMATIHIQTPQQHQLLQPQQIQIQQHPITVQNSERPENSKPGTKRQKVERNAMGAKPYKCTTCGENFASSGVLVKHIRTHTGEKPYNCMHCGTSFTQIGNLHRHMKSHQGIRSHRCNVCGKSFTRRERLLYHSKLHTGEKSFKCGECGRDFVHKINLMAHYNRRHSGFKPHQCDVCQKTFAEKRALKFHQKTHDSRNVEKTHFCTVCGRGFADMERLIKHTRVHANVRPHKCKLCNKSYTLASSLKNHETLHHGPDVPEGERIACPHCPKLFPNKSKLMGHIKIHSEPKYECTVCGKKFPISSNLTNHMRIHSGEKPFACDKCSAAFTQRAHLIRHEKVCVKKRYPCLECTASFRSLASLSKHITRSHGLPPKKQYPCEHCDLHFSSASSLDKHMSAEHEIHQGSIQRGKDVCQCKSDVDGDNTPLDFSQSSKPCQHCSLPKLGNTTIARILAGDKKVKTGPNKPFKCATCSMCFITIQQLRNHAKRHVGEIHQCSACQATFARRAALDEHEITCQVCTPSTPQNVVKNIIEPDQVDQHQRDLDDQLLGTEIVHDA